MSERERERRERVWFAFGMDFRGEREISAVSNEGTGGLCVGRNG